MSSHLSPGASGALRRFAGWLARGTVGYPMLVNEKHAERRAAAWIHRYCTGELPPEEPDIEPWECQLH